MFPANTTGNDNCKMNIAMTFEALKKIICFKIKEYKWKLRPFWNWKHIFPNRAAMSVARGKDHSYTQEEGLDIRVSEADNRWVHGFGTLAGPSPMTRMWSH